jgi:hypothetical protein
MNFLTEFKLISNFNHENIISFIGYPYEGNEMIMVMIMVHMYSIYGSIDHFLERWKNLILVIVHPTP